MTLIWVHTNLGYLMKIMETHRIFTFKDAVIKKIMETEVIPDHQIMKIKISIDPVQVFESGFYDSFLSTL